MTVQPAAAALPRPVASPEEARELVAHFSEVMDTLLQMIEEETELVRAGRLREAAKLSDDKSALARLYLADTVRLQASKPYLAQTVPALLDSLRARHDTFRSLLQINLTVLATAHAISEAIIRGVNTELQRKRAPSTYTASGSRTAPNPRNAAPLAISRTL